MTRMTLEERERRAYANGNVHEAALLALSLDQESEATDELDHEVRQLKTQVEKLEDELNEKDETIVRLESEPRCICA